MNIYKNVEGNLLVNEDKFVDIKIRYKYKKMLKDFATRHGYKMYRLVEQIIEKECAEKDGRVKP